MTCCASLDGNLLDQIGNERRPARLVRGTAAPPIVAVEILVERDVVPEITVCLKFFVTPENRAPAVGVADEKPQQTPAQLVRDLVESHHLARPGRALDGKSVSIELMEA